MNIQKVSRNRKLREDEEEKEISGAEYSKRLRTQLLMNKETDNMFALQEKKDVNDDVDELLRTTKRFVGKNKVIGPDTISLQRMALFSLGNDNGDTNQKKRFKSQIRFVRFHRSEPQFLVVNGDNYIHIYEVKNGVCECRKMIHVTRFIVNEACWTSKNTLLLSPINREFLMYYDIERDTYSQVFNMPGYQEMKESRICISPDGRRALLLGSLGSIFSVDLSTRRTEEPRQLASKVRDMCFYDDDTCYLVTEDNYIVEYNLNENTVIANYWDKDLFGACRITINGNYMAIGDSAGLLSIYTTPTMMNTEENKESHRVIHSMKTLKNLVTQIDSVSINNDNTIAVYSSREKKDHIRVVHLPSLTVYANWPTVNEGLGFVRDLSISGDNCRDG